MAYANAAGQYVNYGNGTTTGYYALTKWAAGAAVTVGMLRRQLTVTGFVAERVFVCIVAGTTGSTEPTWVLTKGARSPATGTDGTAVVWMEVTGQPGVNGDVTARTDGVVNCPQWTVSSTPALGTIIYVPSNGSLQICTTSGAGGATIPGTFSTTPSTPAADGSASWTSLGLASSFSIWSAPHARLNNAWTSTWGFAGQDFYVSSIHAETQSTAMTLTSPGTVTTPCRVICVAQSPASTPPGSADVTTGASISTSGNTDMSLCPGTNMTYIYGVAFTCSNGAGASGTFSMAVGVATLTLENCSVVLGTTFGNPLKVGPATASQQATVLWNNVKWASGNSAQAIQVQQADFTWRNTPSGAFSGAQAGNPAVQANPGPCNILLEGLDLSNNTHPVVGSVSGGTGYACVKDCKLPPGIAWGVAGTGANFTVDLVRSDTAGATYRNERLSSQGSQTTDTQFYRNGGASDGTTPVSHMIVTSSNGLLSTWNPFLGLPIAIWNGTTGSSVHVTLFGIVNAAVVPNNDGFWFEAEYLGTSGSAVGSFASAFKANVLAAPAALTADSTSSWSVGAPLRTNGGSYSPADPPIAVASNPGRLFFCTTTGNSAGSEPTGVGGYSACIDGGSVTDNTAVFRAGCRFSVSLNVTPQQAGYIYAYPKYAQMSTSYFIDPLIVLT